MRSSRYLLASMLVMLGLAQDLTTEMIEAMGNNSLFTRWRPYSHINAPAGWMVSVSLHVRLNSSPR